MYVVFQGISLPQYLRTSIVGRKALLGITAVKRMVTSTKSLDHLSAAAQALAPHLEQYKEESEKENIDEGRNVVHYDDGESGPDSSSASSVPTSPNLRQTHKEGDSQSGVQLAKALKEMSIDQPGT